MGHQHTILIVEDDAHFRQTLTWALQARHWRVLAASSGGEALGILVAESPICAILLDATLPDMAIGQLCHELRRLTAVTPLIIMSGDPLQDVQERVRVNPRAFLAKPFDLAVLYGTLNAAFKG